MSFGSQKSSSSSKPLTAEERKSIYDQGITSINSSVSGSNLPGYTKTNYQGLAGGDYNALQDSILQGQTVGLDRQKFLDSQSIDSNLAKRGIWSSGLAERAQAANNEAYATSYLKAGADATAARYGLQATDLQNQNTFNAGQDAAAYTASWQPLNYYADLWKGTAGQTSSSSGKGFNAALGGG